mmetsp:Transcript_70060/g.221227  ORF Transcript_70060/g.221227 Transcript_70060/m.221227 type:complete len:115 (-) Transcript_70060:349-693(-)
MSGSSSRQIGQCSAFAFSHTVLIMLSSSMDDGCLLAPEAVLVVLVFTAARELAALATPELNPPELRRAGALAPPELNPPPPLRRAGVKGAREKGRSEEGRRARRSSPLSLDGRF